MAPAELDAIHPIDLKPTHENLLRVSLDPPTPRQRATDAHLLILDFG